VTRFPIVCPDLAAVPKSLRVIGGTASFVVLDVDGTQLAYKRETGEQAPVPSTVTPIAPAGPVTRDGITIEIRAEAIVRVRGARSAIALAQDPKSPWQAALVPELGAVVTTRADGTLSGPQLGLSIVGWTGPILSLQNVPTWVINDKHSYELDLTIPWTIAYEPTARVVVIATPRRAAWITVEALVALTQVKVLDYTTKVEVAVAKKPRQPALDYFWLDRRVYYNPTAGDLAASVLVPELAERLAALHALGLGPDADRAEVLAGDHASVLNRGLAENAGTLLARHLMATPRPDVISGKHTAIRAARANAELAAAGEEERFVSFDYATYEEPVFVRVSEATKQQLAKLVALDPELPAIPDVRDAATLAAALAKLTGVTARDCTWTQAQVRVELAAEAAHTLEQFLPYP
jgi:hypothetical protein